jgi:hypothetical protein
MHELCTIYWINTYSTKFPVEEIVIVLMRQFELCERFWPENIRKRRQEDTTLQPQIDIGALNGSVGFFKYKTSTSFKPKIYTFKRNISSRTKSIVVGFNQNK